MRRIIENENESESEREKKNSESRERMCRKVRERLLRGLAEG